MERTPSPRPEGRRDSSQPAGQGDQSQSHDAEALERKRRESTRFFESVPGSSVPLAGSSRGDGQSHTPEREEGPLTKRRRLGTWQSGGLFGTQSEGQYTLGSVPVEAFSSSRSQEHVDPQTEKDLEFILRENILKNVTSDDASDCIISEMWGSRAWEDQSRDGKGCFCAAICWAEKAGVLSTR